MVHSFLRKGDRPAGRVVGLQYLYHLLKFPNRPSDIRNFLADVSGRDEARAASGDGEAKMDEQERAECVARLRELAIERRQAETEKDSAWLARIDEEFQKIEAQVNREKEFQGHARTLGRTAEIICSNSFLKTSWNKCF